MKVRLLTGRTAASTPHQKGAVLVVVIAFATLVVMSTLALSTMVQRDAELIRVTRDRSQAQYVAEAGLHHALARFKSENFASRSDFTGDLDTGSYSVTFSEESGRHLITSIGTVGNNSKTASIEVENLMPTAMFYLSAAGNDIRINSFVADAEINGDIHANNDVYLKSGPLIAFLMITGDVSATGVVKEGSRLHQADGLFGGFLDLHVYINGVNQDDAFVDEGAPRVIFPTFNYDQYRQAAEDSGEYYDTDTTFNGQTVDPSEGIVYVNGNARFEGNCTINGGVVADEITVTGTLNQVKKGNRNVVIAKEGDIGILGRLYTEEAVVYAGRDIRSLQVLAEIEINGVIMARRDIYMWNFLTRIDYNYVETYPTDVGDQDDQQFGIISWNL